MKVNKKYLKDENGNIFSPIISSESVIVGGGLSKRETKLNRK